MTEEGLFPNLGYRVETGWCPRFETPTELAERWLTLIERLKTLDPILATWWDWTDLSDIEPMSADVGHVAARIAANGARQEDGTPLLGIKNGTVIEVFPYRISAHNCPAEGLEGRHDVQLDAWAGSGHDGGLPHTLDFETDVFVSPDPVFTTYAMARSLLLALVEVFVVDKGMAFPQRLMRSWNLRQRGDRAHLFPAWISYVGPRFAHLVVPPVSAIVEYRPDGGVLMAATTDTFDLGNQRHLDNSRDIAEGAKAFRWSSEGWLTDYRSDRTSG